MAKIRKNCMYAYTKYWSTDNFKTWTCDVSGATHLEEAKLLRKLHSNMGYACGAIRKLPAPDIINILKGS